MPLASVEHCSDVETPGSWEGRRYGRACAARGFQVFRSNDGSLMLAVQLAQVAHLAYNVPKKYDAARCWVWVLAYWAQQERLRTQQSFSKI